ncbi:methyltransferase domain-containing protein [Calidifontibacter indicus]|uniref:23S rRNA m(5)U-747 methyltransferase n=1 Tax=Calidifontibacter indicus TaxID=419650 RepID=A0A3D9URU8_9MICO|nr:methyltransferase domain-containing protein [Calidifontibacter indicus]REF31213.1 23S rRNA m(5)U-747 methyltransferase [Calidifontibacter indicus]
MRCGYFDRHECRSCTLMNVPYADQVASGDDAVRATLADRVDSWLPSATGPEAGFRNKAKLVVAGRRGAPALGILDAGGNGVDLTGCGLYEPGLAAALPTLREFVADIGLTPYDVPTRNGELKNLLVTYSPDGELMVRFVLRSTGQLGKLERALPDLQQRLPNARVVTANLLPGHRAVMEGEEEIVLTEHDTLPMRLGTVRLHLRPASFFQTNTTVAEQLYRQAATWIGELAPGVLLDLFCGVGGFGLTAAGAGVREVFGVEISADAVSSARRSAAELDSPTTTFHYVAGDAFHALADAPSADVVVVNPPRRGIGDHLCDWLEHAQVEHLVYSSCNPRSLATDLDRMPGFVVERARVFHMFPQSTHHEVLVQLARR